MLLPFSSTNHSVYCIFTQCPTVVINHLMPNQKVLTFEKHSKTRPMTEQQLKYYSISEYLTLEEQSEERHEYEAGQIRAMSGGTINHGRIGTNMTVALANSLGNSDCEALHNDVRVWIEAANSFVYPDAMVVCGAIETAEQDEHSIINPTTVIEVLSEYTEAYDRGDKLHKYALLPSLKEYILVDQSKPVVDTFYRKAPGYWKVRPIIGLDKSITLSSIGCSIKMEDIYRNARELEEPAF